jgi:heme/copper-type cytochrome/quinol oxidase subunit 4
LLHPAARWFFYPCYGLAVLAAFVHLATALHYKFKNPTLSVMVILCGGVVAALILVSFGGWFFPIKLPDAYVAYCTQFG